MSPCKGFPYNESVDAVEIVRRAWRCGVLVLGLAGWLVGCSCSDQSLAEEEEPPDIEGLCQVYCERVMECRWTPDSAATFSTVEGCAENCRNDVLWDRCPDRNEALLRCETAYECPEFANFGCRDDQGQCCAEIRAASSCAP